jgi:hypothetical protein
MLVLFLSGSHGGMVAFGAVILLALRSASSRRLVDGGKAEYCFDGQS